MPMPMPISRAFLSLVLLLLLLRVGISRSPEKKRNSCMGEKQKLRRRPMPFFYLALCQRSNRQHHLLIRHLINSSLGKLNLKAFALSHVTISLAYVEESKEWEMNTDRYSWEIWTS